MERLKRPSSQGAYLDAPPELKRLTRTGSQERLKKSDSNESIPVHMTFGKKDTPG